MNIWFVAAPLGLAFGILLALGVWGLLFGHLVGARKHENTLLPYLHIAWILTTIAFVAYWVYRANS